MTSLDYQRRQKDGWFRSYSFPDGPLTEEQLKTFTGLHYFPENPSWRLHLTVDKLPGREIITMTTSKGSLTEFERYGRIHFTVNGQAGTLEVYRGLDGGELFLPFMDATTGVETYAGGRYLEPEDNLDGTIEVNFNLAYNPYCAYNEQWNCPLPPKQNRLPMRVEAGEKKFHE